MPKLLLAFAKFVVIAFAAAVASWLPVAILASTEPFARQMPGSATELFPFALLGSFGIGLPVAIATFVMARRHLAHSPSTLVLIVLLSAVMIALTSLVLLDASAAFVFGIPSLLAAMTYAIMGWYWVLKPMRGEAGAEL